MRAEKLPRKRASWCHGKEHRGLILFYQSHERTSWMRAEKLKITTEKSIVVPRKRTSWSYQAHRKEHPGERRKTNYHIKERGGGMEEHCGLTETHVPQG
jgi:hypothetical protein